MDDVKAVVLDSCDGVANQCEHIKTSELSQRQQVAQLGQVVVVQPKRVEVWQLLAQPLMDVSTNKEA